MVTAAEPRQIEDFSLILGGPLYQLMLRARLIQPPFGNLGFRIAAITAVAWLPLLLMTLLDARFSGSGQMPFLYDCEVHARLLFALPLMILAEVVVYTRMRAITAQFVERQIVTPGVRASFDAVISSAMRLRNSVFAESALLLFAVFGGPFLWRGAVALHANAWYATITNSGLNYTAAGNWYTFVSVPIFQFILLRWYFRLFIWARFLFQVSRLDLNLLPIHPDRCCGLGFLGTVASAFAPLLMAHSGLVSGFIANRILHDHAALPDYKVELAAMGVLLLVIVLGPLCVFVPKLAIARLVGLRTYGRLASDYVVGFAGKWTGSVPPLGEALVGTSDIQSLADLDKSFAIVREMKIAPFGKEAVVRFLVIIALPLIPLGLTMFSAEELLRRLIKIVL